MSGTVRAEAEARLAALTLRSSRFRAEREADWRELEGLLAQVERGGAGRLSVEEMVRLPRAYRAVLSALSVARETSLDKGLTDYLEALSTRAYFAVYGNRERLPARLAAFLTRGWPEAVQSMRRETLASAAFLFGAALAGFLLVSGDHGWYDTLMGGSAQGRSFATPAEALRDGLYHEAGASGLAAFAASLLSNNALVAILAFALGFAFCAPTAVLLVLNGAVLGAFVALYVEKGLGFELGGWLLIHGVTELLAIVLGGAAGLKIGWAMAFPGPLSRVGAAARAGREAGAAVAGVVLMLVVAALLEGFGRQLITSDGARYAIAGGSALFWAAYLYLPRGPRVPEVGGA